MSKTTHLVADGLLLGKGDGGHDGILAPELCVQAVEVAEAAVDVPLLVADAHVHLLNYRVIKHSRI